MIDQSLQIVLKLHKQENRKKEDEVTISEFLDKSLLGSYEILWKTDMSR